MDPRPADSQLHLLIIHRCVAKALALMPDFIALDFDLDSETTTRLKAHISTRGIPVIALAKLVKFGPRALSPKGA